MDRFVLVVPWFWTSQWTSQIHYGGGARPVDRSAGSPTMYNGVSFDPVFLMFEYAVMLLPCTTVDFDSHLFYTSEYIMVLQRLCSGKHMSANKLARSGVIVQHPCPSNRSELGPLSSVLKWVYRRLCRDPLCSAEGCLVQWQGASSEAVLVCDVARFQGNSHLMDTGHIIQNHLQILGIEPWF